MIQYHYGCFHMPIFKKNLFVLFFIPFPFISHYFNSTIKELGGGNLTLTRSIFFLSLSLSLSLRVVCLTKQHYKSNSTAVNRLQNWLSPASSPRNGRIINTDLYCSQVANTHLPIWRLFVDSETTPGNPGCFYYEVLKGLAVERRQGWGAAAVGRKRDNSPRKTGQKQNTKGC